MMFVTWELPIPKQVPVHLVINATLVAHVAHVVTMLVILTVVGTKVSVKTIAC